MTVKARAKRWTKIEATALLDRADASGLSDRAFARSVEMNVQRISWWRKSLDRRRRQIRRGRPKKTPDFVELRPPIDERLLAPSARGPSLPGLIGEIEIQLTNGRSVRVPSSIDLSRLEHLLMILDRRPC